MTSNLSSKALLNSDNSRTVISSNWLSRSLVLIFAISLFLLGRRGRFIIVITSCSYRLVVTIRGSLLGHVFV